MASNTLVLKLQTKEKDLTSRLRALEDLAAKNSAEMKQLMAKYEMEKDINERLLWRIQRQENCTSSPNGDTAKNKKIRLLPFRLTPIQLPPRAKIAMNCRSN